MNCSDVVIYKFNSIASSIKKLINIRQCFFGWFFYNLFPVLIFLRHLLNSSCLCHASSSDISHLLILSRKAAGYFKLLRSFSRPPILKLVSAIFYQVFIFHQMIALQKLWKKFFISSKKLFSFLRYLNFCIFVFPSFFSYQPLL